MQAAKPGVVWTDMHLLANRIILEDLKAGGLLKGDIDQMMEVNLAGEVRAAHHFHQPIRFQCFGRLPLFKKNDIITPQLFDIDIPTSQSFQKRCMIV